MYALLVALALAAGGPSPAQHSPPHGAAEERAAGLRQGLGMGMATPAERNSYPGPKHVLDLADKLGLSSGQHARARDLFHSMEARAQQLGVELLNAEAALDRLFADRRAKSETLEAAVRKVAEIEGALKLVHLETHLEMTALLSPGQVARYVELRRAQAGAAQPAHH